MKGFKNVEIYVEGKGIIKTSLGFENGVISFIGDANEITEPIELPENAVVLPGFIDQHIHGSATADAIDGSVKSIETIATSIACEGTTSFLATTMTQSVENISKALKSIADYRALNSKEGAEVVGVNFEGPYINVAKAGAHPVEYIVNPTIEEFEMYNELSGNCIKVVTIAPELDGGKEFIEYLASKSINASIGHSTAKYEQVVDAVKRGAKQVTHTYNAQSSYGHREIGVAGSALLIDELACEIICDTIHVSIPAIQMLIKNKPHDKVILITDSMRAKNLGDGVSDLAGQKVYVKNGEARLADGTLAGSVLKLSDAVKNVVKHCGVSLTEACDFASANPAKNLGLYDTIGSIKVGKKANFAILDKENFNVLLTIRDGNVIYKA